MNREHGASTWQRRIGTIAALIFLTLLVGSMIFVVTAYQHSKNTTASPKTTILTQASSTPPTPNLIPPPLPGTYITSQKNWNDFQISKLNPRTHAVVWNADAGAITSSFVVTNGVIYVSSADSNDAKYDNYVYAINAASGSLLWRSDVNADVSSTAQASILYTGVLATPIVADGKVFVTARNGKLYALNAANGAKLWTYDSHSPTLVDSTTYDSNQVVVVNNIVYAASANTLFAVDARSGKSLWTQQINNQQLFNAPQVDGNVIYLSSYEVSQHTYGKAESGYIYAYSIPQGKLLWRYSIGNWVLSNPVIVQGVVYFGSYDFNVYALKASNGSLLWRYNTGGEVYDTPLVANGVLYADETGNATAVSANTVQPALLAINASTGSLLWRHTSTSWFTPQSVQNGVLYAGTSPDMVYAFSIKDCSVLWQHKYGAKLVDKYGNEAGASPQITVIP